MNRSLFLRLLFLGGILIAARPAAAQPGAAQSVRANDSLYARPHDIYPEELMKQMPRPDARGIASPSPAAPGTFFQNVNISVDTFPQNEPSVKISRKHPNRAVAAWRDFRNGVSPAIRRVGYSYSTDAGATWSPGALLPILDSVHLRASDPAVGIDTAGNFYITTISTNNTNNDGKILVFRSTDEGVTFDSAVIAPTVPGSSFDDKEYITFDLNPASPFANTLYITWTRFGTPGGIRLTRSTDGGRTWAPSVQVSDGTSVQGSDPAVGPNGEVYAVWAGPGVVFDKSTDGGATFGVDSVISAVTSLHGFPSMAVDLSDGARKGTIYVTWSDRRNGDDDVFLSSSSNGGVNWSAPLRVNDDPFHNGELQYWPWIAVDDQGKVAIVYLDTRNTANNSIFNAYLARSSDGGATFTNQRLSSAPSPSNTPNSDVRFGDYIGIDAWDSHYVAVWTDERAGGYNMDIYTAVVAAPKPASVPVAVSAGWNLVSLPATVGNPALTSVYPTATSPAFAYAGTYEIRPNLGNGTGYWLKFGADQSVKVRGDSLALDSITVYGTWNLIGSISAPVPVAAVGSNPPGIVVSHYFGYGAGYHAVDTITPGTGYWVKCSLPGRLALSQSLAKRAAPPAPSLALGSLNRITISDARASSQTLYFGASSGDPRALNSEVPPPPPGGIFDARFSSQRLVELFDAGDSRLAPILISGASYPLKIDWQLRDAAASLLIDGRTLPLAGSGSARIARPVEHLALGFSPTARGTALPAVTKLEQNYPNPFNPSTTVAYAVARPAFVTLKVYDVLGREVRTLVSESKEAGNYRIEWDAAGVPSGLYFCRLTAGAFSGSRTMSLVR